MNNLSRFTESIKWITASPTTDLPEDKAAFLVSRGSIRKKGKIVRTYVLINYDDPKIATKKNGTQCDYKSIIYRKDLLKGTSLSRISAIIHFTESFAHGDACLAFFYPDQQWEEDLEGFSLPLIQFMKNYSP